VKSLFHNGLIHILLKHELVKYHISWERFLSKIQLSDNKHLKNYSNDHEKRSFDSKKSDRDVSVGPKNKKQLNPDLPELDQSKIDIDFANKRKC